MGRVQQAMVDWKWYSAGGAVVSAVAAYGWLQRPHPPAADLPLTMKRLVLAEPNPQMDQVQLLIEQVPIPTLKPGQVLIKMAAAPINPSDYGGWKRANPTAAYPISIGNEGSGVVVASGGGVPARGMVGKTGGVVAVGLNNQGTYQEYMAVSAMNNVFPIPDVAAEDAASFFVNPYTAVAITEYVKRKKSRSFVHTAASSQLGQMLVKLCAQQGDLIVINVVRRQEQVKMLKDLDGSTPVVCQADPAWEEQLRKLIETHDCTVAFDAISGQMSGTIMRQMPPRSTLYVWRAFQRADGQCGDHGIDLSGQTGRGFSAHGLDQHEGFRRGDAPVEASSGFGKPRAKGRGVGHVAIQRLLDGGNATRFYEHVQWFVYWPKA